MVNFLKPVPTECQALVEDDDVVYTVPGDGLCGPKCLGAHVFEDEVFGSEVHRKMNSLIVKSIKYYENKVYCASVETESYIYY